MVTALLFQPFKMSQWHHYDNYIFWCYNGIINPIDLLEQSYFPAHFFFYILAPIFFRDISPMGSTLEETNRYLDEMTDLALELQQQTGVKLLWATCNLFAHPTYACGASTNPDAHIFAMAAAQVKKGLEIAKKLGAEGFGKRHHSCF